MATLYIAEPVAKIVKEHGRFLGLDKNKKGFKNLSCFRLIILRPVRVLNLTGLYDPMERKNLFFV